MGLSLTIHPLVKREISSVKGELKADFKKISYQ